MTQLGGASRVIYALSIGLVYRRGRGEEGR